jgi:hypothetical protein
MTESTAGPTTHRADGRAALPGDRYFDEETMRFDATSIAGANRLECATPGR